MIKPPAISPIDGLVDLACRDGVDVRPTLLRVLTDLYVQKPVHSSDETTQYVELALGLIGTVDAATRAAVAASLSHYPAAPAAVMIKLGLAVEMAAPRAALPDVTFVPEPVQLGASPPPQVVPPPLLQDRLTDIFFLAPPGDRRLILANLDVVASPVTQLAPAPAEVIARLEEAALKRAPAAVARLIESALGISRDLANRVVDDTSGEPIVIVARALNIKADVLQRVLLFLNPSIGQSVERVFDLAVLYDEISQPTAWHMVSLWRQDAPAARLKASPKGRHESVYQDDARTVRRAATNEQRPTHRRAAAVAASHKSSG